MTLQLSTLSKLAAYQRDSEQATLAWPTN